MKMCKRVLPISLLVLLSACNPEESLNPLFKPAERKSEAYFFVGYEYFLTGDKQEAREYFQKVLDVKVLDSEEYTVARARLAQLGPK